MSDRNLIDPDGTEAAVILEDDNYQKPPSITESITIFLREAILSGKMKPGQKINEKEITERLSVSRSPLREALRTVAKEELVTISPYKGASVAEISAKELRDLFEVREMIELFAMDLIERHSVADFNELKQSLDFDPEQLRKLGIGEYLNEVTKFHVALVKTAGNAKLCQLHQVLSNSLIRYQRIVATIPDRMELSVDEHVAILEALSRREFVEAKDLLGKHIEALKLKIFQESSLSSLENAGDRR